MKHQPGGPSGGGPTEAFDVMTGAASAEPGYSSAADVVGGAELLEERTVRLTGGGHGRRFGLSVPGAVAGSFLVVALAFGAAMGPLASRPASDGAGTDEVATEPTKKPAADEPAPAKTTTPDEPKTAENQEPAPEKTPTPVTEPTEKPAPPAAPDSVEIQIGAALDGSKVVVEWSACQVDGFAYYKVIRSKDQYATWPLGSGDALAAAIGDASVTRFVDTAVDGGRTYTYRIVALREWEGQTVVACSSVHAAITTPMPTPKPVPTDGGGSTGGTFDLVLSLKESHPLIDWTACPGAFSYYKVVRSSDSNITWPPTGDDTKVAAVGVDGDTKAWDAGAPGGTTVHYAVFCIRDGVGVVAASPVKSIQTPALEPAPAPVALGFTATVTAEGVALDWDSCTSGAFAFYKVVRSLTNPNPSYLPGTDGSQVIGVIESAANSAMVDGDVASGQTIYYRIQAIGYWYGSKILLGETTVIAVTIP